MYNLWVTKFFVNHNDHVHTQFVNHKIFCESQTKIKLFRILTGPWPDQTMHGQVWWTHPPSRLWLTKKFVTHKFFLCERCWDNVWFTNFRPYYLLTYIIIFATSCLSKFWFAEACSNKSNLIFIRIRNISCPPIHVSKGTQPQQTIKTFISKLVSWQWYFAEWLQW